MTLNPNSAIHWLPAAAAAAREDDVSVPETAVTRFDFMDALAMIDGGEAKAFPWDDLERQAEHIGYPVFVRSDLASAKHAGIGATRARQPAELRSVVSSIVRESAKHMLKPAALLIRGWLDIEHSFTAKGGLPIGPEFRVFTAPRTYHCTHFYWPADSLEATAPEGWKRRHQELAAHPIPTALQDAAETASRLANDRDELPDNMAWSVDFAMDTDGDWWLIDMALAVDSWHPDDCEVSFGD